MSCTAKLKDLAASENPVLSIAAFRALSTADALKDEETCKLILRAPSVEQQAAFVLLYIRSRPVALYPAPVNNNDAAPRLLDRMDALIDAVASEDHFNHLRGVAVAIFVRYKSPPVTDLNWKAGRKTHRRAPQESSRFNQAHR